MTKTGFTEEHTVPKHEPNDFDPPNKFKKHFWWNSVTTKNTPLVLQQTKVYPLNNFLMVVGYTKQLSP